VIPESAWLSALSEEDIAEAREHVRYGPKAARTLWGQSRCREVGCFFQSKTHPGECLKEEDHADIYQFGSIHRSRYPGCKRHHPPARRLGREGEVEGGVSIKQMYWTLGHYDQVCVFEAPDDETVAAVLLAADMLGNIRTETLRAFTAPEMEKILGTVP